MDAFYRKIKERKILPTILIYVASCWGILQAVDFFSSRYAWPRFLFDLLLALMICGLPLVIIVQWFQNPEGSRKILKLKLSLILVNVVLAASVIFYLIATRPVHSGRRPPDTSGKSRVLVLPFSTVDTSRIYFADGITTDLVTEIAKIRGFTTIAWNTSFNYANTTKSFKQIADETGATHFVVGKVQRSATKVRINVSLIDPESDDILWTQSWDEDLSKIFDIQKHIAIDISRELSYRLSPEEERILSQRYKTNSTDAYDLLLKARAELRKLYNDPAPLFASKKYLDEALAIDPNFPDALIMKAYVRTESAWVLGLDPAVQFEEGQKEITAALRLLPNSSDAYAVAGLINFFFAWNMENARKNFEKSWELSNYGETSIYQCNCGFVGYKIARGDFNGALAIIEKIEKLDPNYIFGSIERLMVYRSLHDTLKIKAVLNSVRDLERTKPFEPAYFYELGKYKESIASFKRANTSFIWPSTYLASAYYKAGLVSQSDSIITEMIKRSKVERNFDFALSVIFAAKKEKMESIKWFKSAFEKHDFWLPYARGDADLKLIINEPEIAEILNKLKL